MSLGLDNGNYNTKTSDNVLYASGYTETNTEPITLDKVVKYNGKFYIIGDNRNPVENNKASNDDTFIMSLPALAEHAKLTGEHNIKLGVGLPIALYGEQQESFKRYFERKVDFEYEGKPYHIEIEKCFCYPQGFAALISDIRNLKNYHTLYLIDIGGYTVDVLTILNGEPTKDKSFSLAKGIIELYTTIKSELMSHNILLNENQITEGIRGAAIQHLNASIIESVITAKKKAYVRYLLNSIREHDIDLRNPVVFAGGGAELLYQDMDCNDVYKIALLDRFANAKGYKILLDGENNG